MNTSTTPKLVDGMYHKTGVLQYFRYGWKVEKMDLLKCSYCVQYQTLDPVSFEVTSFSRASFSRASLDCPPLLVTETMPITKGILTNNQPIHDKTRMTFQRA